MSTLNEAIQYANATQQKLTISASAKHKGFNEVKAKSRPRPKVNVDEIHGPTHEGCSICSAKYGISAGGPGSGRRPQ